MLCVEKVTITFCPGRLRKPVVVLSGVDLTLEEGETCGLLGPSGSGKTTLARVVTSVISPSGGRVLFRGKALARLSGRSLRTYRRKVQMIFQNPHQSLDPKQTVAQTVAEPLLAHGLVRSRRAAAHRVRELLVGCGLPEDILSRRPMQISGGQAQRVALARALALEPEILIGDEMTAMLDVSVQAQVLALVARIQRDQGMAVLLISHDADLIRAFCSRAAILKNGRITADGKPGDVLPKSVDDTFPFGNEAAPCLS